MDRVMLKMYWRAEGLVEQTEMKNLEEEMEIYLDKLISSSLVIAFNEIGDYSSCQLHDLVHDFCLIKAREEKWFVQISSSDPSSSSDLMASIVIINYDKEHFKPNNFVLLNSIKKRHSGKHLCSSAITGDKIEDRLPDACHLRDLRLLRVLDLSPSFMMVKNSLLNEICMLNHLRFLNIGTEVKYLPSSFSNLRNLETLVVINEGSTLVLLPSIWDLVKLRVLSIDACCFFDLDTDEPILITKDSKLENLRVLEIPVLSYAKGIEDIFICFPNLQRFTFNSLSTIARFPNLEELFLTRTIIQGEEWNMGEEDTFVNLKYLNLDGVSPAKWEVGEKSFPVLEKLDLRGCRKLDEIPPSFGDICSLKIIKLVKSPQLEDSAKKIKQYVEDMGGNEFQVLGQNNIPLFK
ncbi:hypothetical protein P3S67_032301 [Capsicum chacoense]